MLLVPSLGFSLSVFRPNSTIPGSTQEHVEMIFLIPDAIHCRLDRRRLDGSPNVPDKPIGGLVARRGHRRPGARRAAKIKNRRTARRGATAPAMAPCQIRRSHASAPRLSLALARRPSRRVYARAGASGDVACTASWRRCHCCITRSGLALPHAPSRTRDRPLCAARSRVADETDATINRIGEYFCVLPPSRQRSHSSAAGFR